jgi:uncharacterized protein YceK
MKKFSLLVACILMAGCATVAEKIAEGVTVYCVHPLPYRLIYRNTVNAQLAATGHKVHVHCAGDPEPERL